MVKYIKIDRALFDSVVFLLDTLAAPDALGAENIAYFRSLSARLRVCDTPGLREMVEDIEHNREMQGAYIEAATEMATKSRHISSMDARLESLHFMVCQLAKAHSAGFKAQFPDTAATVEEKLLDDTIRHRAEQDTSPKN